jgi:hypothetical protein
MLKRLAITTAAVLAILMVPGVAPASANRHCGAIKVDGTPFQVFVEAGSASCIQARAIMSSLYHGHHREVCYRYDRTECRNGHPTDRANTVILVGVWRCGTGAGGGGCTHGRERISAAYIESPAEKTAQAKREDAENKATVIECENNPHLVLMQVGAPPRYIYECLSTEKLAEECSEGTCREPMYGASEAFAKWEARVREACHAIGDVVTPHTRRENGVLEYECALEEGSARIAWVSVPYMPPEEYAGWSAA